MFLEELLNSDSSLLVTNFEVQKNDSTRISVFLNNQFAFGISYSTFEEFKIQKDMVLGKEQIKQIFTFENLSKAKNEALNFIAKKMRTEWEIKTRLRRKDFSDEVIDQIIQDFRERKYVDDLDYAEAYVRDFVKFKNDGIYKLRKKLTEKRIKSEFIESAISRYINNDEQYEKALKLANKKILSIHNKENKKEKVYRFLSQKGFESEIVTRVLNEIFLNG